jgi:hypothetical protein
MKTLRASGEYSMADSAGEVRDGARARTASAAWQSQLAVKGGRARVEPPSNRDITGSAGLKVHGRLWSGDGGAVPGRTAAEVCGATEASLSDAAAIGARTRGRKKEGMREEEDNIEGNGIFVCCFGRVSY